jgi:AcrR family transcriptional regulator
MVVAASIEESVSRTARLPKSERREQLMAVARSVFVEQGYHSASMEIIADTAGVSKPLLYQHFPSKLDLYLALLDAGIDDLLAKSDASLRDITDNKMRVIATVQTYFEFVDDPQDAYRLVFESDLTNEPQVRARLERLDQEVIKRIAAVIKEDTGLSESQATLLGAGLHGMAQVAATNWLRDPTLPREDAAELVSLLSWRGISGFPLSHPPE